MYPGGPVEWGGPVTLDVVGRLLDGHGTSGPEVSAVNLLTTTSWSRRLRVWRRNTPVWSWDQVRSRHRFGGRSLQSPPTSDEIPSESESRQWRRGNRVQDTPGVPRGVGRCPSTRGGLL